MWNNMAAAGVGDRGVQFGIETDHNNAYKFCMEYRLEANN
jgi:hypothetical protein